MLTGKTWSTWRNICRKVTLYTTNPGIELRPVW